MTMFFSSSPRFRWQSKAAPHSVNYRGRWQLIWGGRKCKTYPHLSSWPPSSGMSSRSGRTADSRSDGCGASRRSHGTVCSRGTRRTDTRRRSSEKESPNSEKTAEKGYKHRVSAILRGPSEVDPCPVSASSPYCLASLLNDS